VFDMANESIPQHSLRRSTTVELAKQVALDGKRGAAIAAKDAAAPVKMNWDSKPPTFYAKQLEVVRAGRPTPSADEKRQRAVLDERRTFRTAARVVFRIADQDGSGSLEYSELMRIDDENTGEMLAALDADQSGDISLDEWLAFTSMVFEKHGAPPAYGLLEMVVQALFDRQFIEEADAVFARFDRDGSGVLDYAEVAAMFPDPPARGSRSRRRDTIMNDEAYAFVQLLDEDRSGSLDRDEWRNFMMTAWRMNPPAARAFCAHMCAMADERGFGK